MLLNISCQEESCHFVRSIQSCMIIQEVFHTRYFSVPYIKKSILVCRSEHSPLTLTAALLSASKFEFCYLQYLYIA